MLRFSRNNLAITGVVALTLFLVFAALSATPAALGPTSIEPTVQLQEDLREIELAIKQIPPNSGAKPEVDLYRSALECEFLDSVQRFSCIVNGRFDHSLEPAFIRPIPN